MLDTVSPFFQTQTLGGLDRSLLQSMAAITPKQDFSYMPSAAREEAERRSKTLNLGIQLQYALEQHVGWHRTLDKSIQAAQDWGLLQPGSLLQQAVDQLSLDMNKARHEPFGLPDQPRAIPGHGPMAMLLGPADSSG